MDKITCAQSMFTKHKMMDMVLPTLLGDNCTHKWVNYSVELAYEKTLYDNMLKRDLPPNPFQVLIDQKYAYVQLKIQEDDEWKTRPSQYPILLSLLFICQRANLGVTTTYRPRKQKQVVGVSNNCVNNNPQNNDMTGHAQV